VQKRSTNIGSRLQSFVGNNPENGGDCGRRGFHQTDHEAVGHRSANDPSRHGQTGLGEDNCVAWPTEDGDEF